MNIPEQAAQGIKATIDTYVIITGVAAFVADVMPTLAVAAAFILSIIRIVNEWPQLRKTIKGWFKKTP